MLERSRMKHDVGLEFVHQAHQPLAITNVSNATFHHSGSTSWS